METFNSKLKKEICLQKVSNQELALSMLSGIIKSVGEIKKSSNKEEIYISTEFVEVFECVNNLIMKIYSQSALLNISDDVGFNDRTKYEITLPSALTTQILLDTEVAYYDEEKFLCFNSGISKYITNTKEQIVEYVKGVFVACGTSNITISSAGDLSKKSTGYHLEFVFSSEALSMDFSSLLASVGILSKKLQRKDFFVVYVQDFEQVCSLLGLMGATKSYLDLQNENALREMRNNVNRQNNCFAANVNKLVNASFEQLNNIKIIQDTIGLEQLEPALQSVCYLRLANPDESLDNLVKLSTEKLSKSGIYHRFKKLEKIAKELNG